MNWIQTYTGVRFDVLQPHASQVRLEDVAHALSNLCRFAGHCKGFYSVAQHSVLVSCNVPRAMALQALLHDATEAYCVDIPRPLKHSDALAGYRVVEARIWHAVAVAFKIPTVLESEVKHADTRALLTEQRDLLGPQSAPWSVSAVPFAELIVPVAPRLAKQMFLDRYAELADQEPRDG